MTRNLLWVSLPDQRPRRELYYMSLMPDTHVTALARDEPYGDLTWVPTQYRRPIKRFIEAGAFAWAKGLDAFEPSDFDWVATLELCSLVTGQASKWRRRSRTKQAVITWENLGNQPIYKIPPYKQALESCRDADLLLCTVDAAREHLLENRFSDDVIRVVKPGVDTAVFTPADVPATDPTIVFVSPLAPNKGIDRLLDALRIVQRTIPEATLVVAGKGELAPLVDAAAADPSRRVERVGNLDAPGVARLLRSAAVFCTAPRPTWKWEEQFGLAYVEAQSCGLPVVTTRCGSNHEALGPHHTFVEDDPEAIAAGLLSWLEDREARELARQENRQWVLENHDLLTQCGRMGEAFTEMERR